jgi:hypothetical protein
MKLKKKLKTLSNNKIKVKKAKIKESQINYYQVISKNKKFNFGAFPPSKEGLGMAKSWAEKMSEETGEECIVKKC